MRPGGGGAVAGGGNHGGDESGSDGGRGWRNTVRVRFLHRMVRRRIMTLAARDDRDRDRDEKGGNRRRKRVLGHAKMGSPN